MSGTVSERRIVVASEFWPGSSARGLVAGLRTAGWAVAEVDDRMFFSTPTTTAMKIESRLRRPFTRRSFGFEVLRQCEIWQAEVMLTVKGTLISAPLIRELRKRGVMTVNYYPDYHFNDISIDRMAEFDFVVTTKSFQIEPLNAKVGADRVAFLHHGYSDDVHRIFPGPPSETPVDVLYVGNANPEKAALLRAVAERLPNISLRVVGNRWSSFAKRKALRSAIVDAAPTGDFYAREIACAKIALAFHMGPDSKTGFADLVSTRSFEIPACGTFMLHVDNPEIRSLYEVPSEIDTFANLDELIHKIRYWLARPEQREMVAARGHARAVPAYGYAARGRKLAEMIETRLVS